MLTIVQYYYEPGTGLQFRSMREVERRVNGEEYTPRRQMSFKLDYNKVRLTVGSFTANV